jgi:hypothetical protein
MSCASPILGDMRTLAGKMVKIAFSSTRESGLLTQLPTFPFSTYR